MKENLQTKIKVMQENTICSIELVERTLKDFALDFIILENWGDFFKLFTHGCTQFTLNNQKPNLSVNFAIQYHADPIFTLKVSLAASIDRVPTNSSKFSEQLKGHFTANSTWVFILEQTIEFIKKIQQTLRSSEVEALVNAKKNYVEELETLVKKLDDEVDKVPMAYVLTEKRTEDTPLLEKLVNAWIKQNFNKPVTDLVINKNSFSFTRSTGHQCERQFRFNKKKGVLTVKKETN